MVGSGLRKIAKEHGLKISNGVAYGEIMGYTTTLCEGGGWKRIVIATNLPIDMKDQLFEDEEKGTWASQYRITNVTLTKYAMGIVFYDNPGTMKLVREFIEWFYPQLEKYGALKGTHCPYCGEEILDGGQWKLINGYANHMHNSCMERYMTELNERHDAIANEEGGSYITGTIGAIIGGLIGAVVWAYVLEWGYIAGLIALLISWLARKGYDLLKGKQGRGKLIIIAIVTVVGVILGTFGGTVIEMVTLINSGEALGWTYADIPLWFYTLFVESPEYTKAFTSNIAIGLLFTFLGCFSSFRRNNALSGKSRIKNL